MKSIKIAAIHLFLILLCSCGVESRRMINSQNLTSNMSARELLLRHQWRLSDYLEECTYSGGVKLGCERSFRVVDFNEKTLNHKEVDVISRKVLQEYSLPIELGPYGFSVKEFDGYYDYTYEMNGDVLEICRYGDDCNKWYIYKP